MTSAVKCALTVSALLLSSCVNSPNLKANTRVSDRLICVNAKQYVGRVVGNGHCVSLIKRCSGAPDTIDWRPGERVMNSELQPGTVIATFENGRYPNRRGFHAAIYIKHDRNGIWVWDQWRGKPVHQRLIRTRGDDAFASNNARAYRVVLAPTSAATGRTLPP